VSRVLITGAGGFMGSHVMRHFLIKTDWELVLIDSFRHRGKTSRINQQLQGPDEAKWRERITVITHDLTAPIDPQTDKRIGSIDFVLNIASMSHVDTSIVDPRGFIENNVSEVLTMLEWARGRQASLDLVKHFVHISTDEVFGPAPAGYDHGETDPHKPSNPYSASKAAQEDILYAYWRTYGLPITRTNTMNVFGEMQDPEKYITKIIKRLKRGEFVPVHCAPDGTPGSRYYLHARNQADALLFILRLEPVLYGEGDFTALNIVGEREINNLELARLIAKFMHLVDGFEYHEVDFHSARPGHDLRYALDGARMAALGWRAPYSLEDSLKSTVEWTLEHPEWLGDE
jgi:dTDP-glucose 4,6-dehydratase